MSSTFFLRPSVVTDVAPRFRLGSRRRCGNIGPRSSKKSWRSRRRSAPSFVSRKRQRHSSHSKGRSWSGPLRSSKRRAEGFSVGVSATATPPSWAGISTPNAGAAWVFTRNDGVWTQQGPSWSVPVRWARPARRIGSTVGGRQYRHRGRGQRQSGRRGGVGLHASNGGVDPAGPKLVGTGAGDAQQGSP